jgi:hypothetical protein
MFNKSEGGRDGFTQSIKTNSTVSKQGRMILNLGFFESSEKLAI